MKNSLKILILVLSLLAGIHSGVASTGDGGGDPVSQEFTRVALNLIGILEKEAELYPEVDLAELKHTIKVTRVITKRRVKIDGREVFAKNYTASSRKAGLIVVSRSKWPELSNYPIKKLMHVFHEYLGVMGLEKDSYGISSRISSGLALVENGSVYSLDRNSSCRMRVSVDKTSSSFVFSLLNWGSQCPSSQNISGPYQFLNADYNSFKNIYCEKNDRGSFFDDCYNDVRVFDGTLVFEYVRPYYGTRKSVVFIKE